MFSWIKVAALTCLACSIALANALLNSERPPWMDDNLGAGEIRLEMLREATGNILWIDAQQTPGDAPLEAIVLGQGDFESILPELLSRWQPGAFIVVLTDSDQAKVAHTLAEQLRNEAGLDNVYVLKGGIEAWQAGAK